MTRPLSPNHTRTPSPQPSRNSKIGQIERRANVDGTPLSSWFSSTIHKLDAAPAKQMYKQNGAHDQAPLIAQNMQVPDLNSLTEFPKL